MKKNKLIVLLTLLLISTLSLAQAPEKMSYQAVVRNASNNLVSNQAVGMQISILQGSATGTAVYVETQTPTSNSNGLVTLEIGGGNVSIGTFAGINWANGTYFIKTETDPTGGTTYTITGTSQLLSSPYALYAKTSGNSDNLGNHTATTNIGLSDFALRFRTITDANHSLYYNSTVDGPILTGFTGGLLKYGTAGANNALQWSSAGIAIGNGGTNYRMPLTRGTNGQILVTDASGNLTWQTISSGGISSLNGLTGGTQTFATGTTGTDFNISSSGAIHTFNLPTASSTNSGKLSNTDWTIFNNKENILTFNSPLSRVGNTISLNTVSITNGGTGATTANSALNNLLPSQTSNNGKVLQTDGTNTSWVTPSSGGIQTGNMATRNAISSPSTGQLFMQTDDYPGIYYWEGTAWRSMSGDSPLLIVDLGSVFTNLAATPINFNATHHKVLIRGSWATSVIPEVINLPNPTTCKGRKYTIVISNYDNSNSGPVRFLRLTSGSYKFKAFAEVPTDTLGDLFYCNTSMTIQSDGNTWIQLSLDNYETSQY